MNSNQIILKILWGIEIVLSVRILLFVTPVLINKISSGSNTVPAGEPFVGLLAIFSLIYLAIGLLSWWGHRYTQILHYAAFAVLLLLTLFLAKGAGVSLVLLLPVIFSAIAILIVKGFQNHPEG